MLSWSRLSSPLTDTPTLPLAIDVEKWLTMFSDWSHDKRLTALDAIIPLYVIIILKCYIMCMCMYVDVTLIN